jgi:hypothetical protein
MNSNIKKFIKAVIPQCVLEAKSNYILDRQRNKFRKHCKELLELTDSILRKNNIEYWLNYGTLLGAYRDHSFIKHDYDLDVAVLMNDSEHVKEVMLSAGLRLKFEARFGDWNKPVCLEYRFEYKGVCIDFNFYSVVDNTAYTYDFSFDNAPLIKIGERILVTTELVTNPFCGTCEFEFMGKNYKVPTNTEEYIIANYGKDYRIPVKDFDYHNYATNVKSFSLDEMKSYLLVYYK